jgi:hypothetical protein
MRPVIYTNFIKDIVLRNVTLIIHPKRKDFNLEVGTKKIAMLAQFTTPLE